MTALLHSNPNIKSVKLVTGWGWIENVTSKGLIVTAKSGFMNNKQYRERDIDFVIEVSRESKAKSAAIFGGVVGGLLFGSAGAIGGVVGGALSGAGSDTYAIRFKDGQEIVIQEDRSGNREALRRLSRLTAGATLIASVK